MFKNELLAVWCVLVLSFWSAGCEKKQKPRQVNFEDTVQLEATQEAQKEAINICVGSMVIPKEGYIYYKALLEYIAENLQTRVNFIEKDSYGEVNALLEEGRIDVAFVCGGPYIDGRDRFGLELLVAPQVDGKSVYHSYIIVHKDSDIESFEQLKGKTFVFADPMSNSGKAYPAYLLKQMGETPETFFKEFFYSYAHDTSIRAVSAGMVDAGAVDSLVWNYMDRSGSVATKNTKIIKISPPFGIPPVVVRPTLQKDVKEKIKKLLLDMHQQAKGNAVLRKMLIDKFIEIEDDSYNSIRETKRYLGKR